MGVKIIFTLRLYTPSPAAGSIMKVEKTLIKSMFSLFFVRVVKTYRHLLTIYFYRNTIKVTTSIEK